MSDPIQEAISSVGKSLSTEELLAMAGRTTKAASEFTESHIKELMLMSVTRQPLFPEIAMRAVVLFSAMGASYNAGALRLATMEELEAFQAREKAMREEAKSGESPETPSEAPESPQSDPEPPEVSSQPPTP